MEDFYDDDEVDQFTQEFTDGVKKGIKKAFLEKMDRLEKQNAELLEIKRDMTAFKRNLESETRKVQYELELEKKAIKNAPLALIMKLASEPVFHITKHYEKQPKCDSCNSSREVPYASADGRTIMGPCSCSHEESWYVPKAKKAVVFMSWGNENQEIVFTDESQNERDSIVFKKTYVAFSGNDFESLNHYSALFHTIEEAQAYCDWLNAKYKK